jgi:hypothetical protein
MLRNFNPRRGLLLGQDLRDAGALHLSSEWLTTGLHILGRTGSGKTRLLLAFIEQLIGYRDATLIVLNAKGELGRMVRDATIAAGQARRLVVFDPADTAPVCGYNPLRPNGLDPHTQAKAARDALLAGVGQVGLERTQQLGRFLYLVLAAARLCELTLVEALELLLPDSPIRPHVLRALPDPYLGRALAYFDTLRAGRQDELAASTIARLDNFVSDPTIRRIVTQQTHALDVGAVIRERRILIANFELYRPLRPNEVKLLGRMLVNDVIAHTFGRNERSPIFLVVDEVELFATPDLCAVTDLGREMGLCLFAAHQNLEQLTLEEGDQKLREAMLNNAVTKIVCGSPTYKDLQELGPELFVDEFDPQHVKHDHLEIDPIEETRQSVTDSVSYGKSTSQEISASESETESKSEGETDTTGTSRGISHSEGESETDSESETESESTTLSRLLAYSEGVSDGDSSSNSESETIVPTPDGAITVISGASVSGSTRGRFSSQTEALGKATTTGTATTTGHARTATATRTTSAEGSESHGRNRGRTNGRTTGITLGRGNATQEGAGLAVQTAPWMSHRKRRVPTAFWSFDESLLAFIQKIRRQGVGFFVVKVPTKPAAFVRAPYVKVPWVSAAARTRALETMRMLPYYARPETVPEQAASRLEKLRTSTRAVELAPTAPRKQLPAPGEEWDFALPAERKK